MKTYFQIAEHSLSFAKIVQVSAMKVYFQIAERSLSSAKIVIKNYNHNNSLRKGYILLWDYIQKVVYLHQIN